MGKVLDWCHCVLSTPQKSDVAEWFGLGGAFVFVLCQGQGHLPPHQAAHPPCVFCWMHHSTHLAVPENACWVWGVWKGGCDSSYCVVVLTFINPFKHWISTHCVLLGCSCWCRAVPLQSGCELLWELQVKLLSQQSTPCYNCSRASLQGSRWQQNPIVQGNGTWRKLPWAGV